MVRFFGYPEQYENTILETNPVLMNTHICIQDLNTFGYFILHSIVSVVWNIKYS